VNEQLAATLERRDERFDRPRMIGVCGIDDGLGPACAVCQDGRFVQRAEDWRDPALVQKARLLFSPDQSQDFMT